jgi:hypothetical protein
MSVIERCWVAISDDGEQIVAGIHGGEPPTESPGEGFEWVEYVHADQLTGAVEALTRLAHPTHTPRGEEAVLVQAEVVGIAQAALDAIEVRSDRITTSRTQAQTIACPRCGAAPGQPCTGARGKPRESMHRERHQAL